MLELDIYKKIKCENATQVFVYFQNTLKETIKNWDYFVNWDKVFRNYNDIEIELNILNTLIGSDNIEAKALKLFEQYPNLIKAIPILLALREKQISVLEPNDTELDYNMFDFSVNKNQTPEKSVEFLKKSGILNLFQDRKIKSIPDYMIGTETGLDSNARKNRTGQAMESLLADYIKKICSEHNWQYIEQATKQKIFVQFNKEITVEKSDRIIDFALLVNDKLFLIETNYYSGGGSKLKSTAGEYQNDFIRWKNDGHFFLWVTDGKGWLTTLKPLHDAFDRIDILLNLDMIQNGLMVDYIQSITFKNTT